MKYIEKADTEAIDQIIGFALVASKFLSEQPAFAPKDANPFPGLFDFLIDRLACSCKHPSFKSEDEYRLIVTQPFRDYRYLEFKTRKSTLRPHIPVKIPRRVTGHEDDKPLTMPARALSGRWDFIDRIVVGPTISRELSLQAVEALIGREDLNVEVCSSKVPYRDW